MRTRRYADGGAVKAPDIEPAPVIPDVSTSEPEPLEEIMAEIDAMQSPEREPQLDPIDQLQAPQAAKDWLKRNPRAMYDPAINNLCQEIHNHLCENGIEPYTPDYFERIEAGLAEYDKPAIPEPAEPAEYYSSAESANSTIKLSPKKPNPVVEDDDEDDELENIQHNRRLYSAPVSRDAPSLSSMRADPPLQLTPLQREAAKISGISEAEYKAQLLKLKEAKAQGQYGADP
jgi:hypothetical protein